MRTLLATHAYLDCEVTGYRGEDGSCRRVERWLKRYAGFDGRRLVFDNGSSESTVLAFNRPGREIWPLTPHYASNSVGWDYPHVWRPYWQMRHVLDYRIYDRIFYIATDAAVCSDRLMDFLESRTEGWTSLWCPRYNFPEPCIQVITACPAFMDFFSGPCDPFKYNGRCEEITLPFTHVEKGFVGDRYGEYEVGDLMSPLDQIDYYCQIPDALDFDDQSLPKPRTRAAA